jgi:hypothetical protein
MNEPTDALLTPAEVAALFRVDRFHLPSRASDTLPARLISRLVIDDGHWIWTGARSRQGYGVIGRGGRGSGNIGTHAAMWQLVYGPPPEGLVYDHLCRIPLCCYPADGEYVTRRENTMRGVGVAPRYAARTNCGHGHPLDGITVTKKSGAIRYCKTCARLRMRRINAQRKAVAA